jgi:hypothetical protein
MQTSPNAKGRGSLRMHGIVTFLFVCTSVNIGWGLTRPLRGEHASMNFLRFYYPALSDACHFIFCLASYQNLILMWIRTGNKKYRRIGLTVPIISKSSHSLRALRNLIVEYLW